MQKVWTYAIGSQLTREALQTLENKGQEFVKEWTAHSSKLDASFSIYDGRIIVVKVDENVAQASGCSIDKLLRFIKERESELGTELLNRFLIPYKKSGAVEVVPSSLIRTMLASGEISPDTIIYNTSVATDEELTQWEQPLKETWLKKFVGV